MLRKKPTQSKQQLLLRYPVYRQEVLKRKSLMKNQISLIATFVFPKTGFAKQNRSFEAQWFVEYKWLDYNEVNDNVIRFICKKHLQKLDQVKNKEGAFLRTGFRNCKKALTNFRDHQQSKCHPAALTFEVAVPQCLDVTAIANFFEELKDNRKRMFGEFTEKNL